MTHLTKLRTATADSMLPRTHRLPRRALAHVLLAEDDPDMRALLVQALTSDGFDVDAVADGGELLDWIRAATLDDSVRRRPELIITDVRMPFWTGLEGIELARTMEWSTPVVITTAFGDPETHRRAFELGAYVLDKPFDLLDLRRLALAIVERP